MRTLFIALSIAILPSISLAEDKTSSPAMDPKIQAMMEKASTPGSEHKIFDKYAGNWTYVSKWWMTPTAKPEESNGTAKIQTIFGGRFLRQEIVGTSMGQPYEGLSLTGFDNVKGSYQSVYLNNMSTGWSSATGTFDKADGSIRDQGSFSCPMEASKTKTYRSAMSAPAGDSFRYDFFTTDDKGVEFKMMEIVYKKAA